MVDSPRAMSWKRSLLVAVVLWACLLAATGFAAWLVDERQRASRMGIDDVSLRIPQSFTVVAATDPPAFLMQSIEAVSPNNSHLLLGEFRLQDPVGPRQVLPEITAALVKSQFHDPGQSNTTVHVSSLSQHNDTLNTGPIRTYNTLLCQADNSPTVWHMIVGLATNDQQHYVTFAMRFAIPHDVVSKPILNPLLRNNARIYQAVARTIQLKES